MRHHLRREQREGSRPRGIWFSKTGSALSGGILCNVRSQRIRQAAKRDRKTRFTALWHHVYRVDCLRKAFLSLKRESAAGVDGVTWRQYAEDLEQNLSDLSVRLQRGAYRAKPVKRAYVPKRDGKQRPIGVTVLEDKIVQKATVEVLNAVYETDFLGFSYGSRPGHNAHNALDALSVGIMRRKVNWVLDADIRGYFDGTCLAFVCQAGSTAGGERCKCRDGSSSLAVNTLAK